MYVCMPIVKCNAKRRSNCDMRLNLDEADLVLLAVAIPNKITLSNMRSEVPRKFYLVDFGLELHRLRRGLSKCTPNCATYFSGLAAESLPD